MVESGEEHVGQIAAAISFLLPGLNQVDYTSVSSSDLIGGQAAAWYRIPKIFREGSMPNEPINVTDENFEKVVLQSPIPVVVDFWAPWCGPCKMVAPMLDKLAEEYGETLLIAKVNTDEDPDWAQKFNVSGIPTMLLIDGGEIIHRQVGSLPEPFLRDMISQFLTTIVSSS